MTTGREEEARILVSIMVVTRLCMLIERKQRRQEEVLVLGQADKGPEVSRVTRASLSSAQLYTVQPHKKSSKYVL